MDHDISSQTYTFGEKEREKEIEREERKSDKLSVYAYMREYATYMCSQNARCISLIRRFAKQIRVLSLLFREKREKDLSRGGSVYIQIL